MKLTFRHCDHLNSPVTTVSIKECVASVVNTEIFAGDTFRQLQIYIVTRHITRHLKCFINENFFMAKESIVLCFVLLRRDKENNLAESGPAKYLYGIHFLCLASLNIQ